LPKAQSNEKVRRRGAALSSGLYLVLLWRVLCCVCSFAKVDFSVAMAERKGGVKEREGRASLKRASGRDQEKRRFHALPRFSAFLTLAKKDGMCLGDCLLESLIGRLMACSASPAAAPPGATKIMTGGGVDSGVAGGSEDNRSQLKRSKNRSCSVEGDA
jgi:hypothetical protein